MNFDLELWIEAIMAYAPKVLLAFVAWFIGSFIIKRILKALDKLMIKRDFDESLRPFLNSILNVILRVALVISIAGVLGIDTTAFAAVLAAMAFAIGMALQGSLSNFAGSVLILLFKPFKVGDTINAMGFIGTVREIQPFATILTNVENKTIILPNGPLSNSAIENFSTEGTLKLVMTFGIGYGDDIDKAKSVLRSVVDRCEYVLTEKPIEIMVKELGDSSVNFSVRAWVENANFWPANWFFQEEVKKAFDKEGVGIPYPTMDLNVTSNKN